jgi:membrane carboxypeptidase/penicillin-binding protein PbpC
MIDYEVTVYDNGDTFWYLDDKLHREGGPAVECSNGDRYYYFNGERHRDDGPAFEGGNGTRWWFLNGEKLTEEEHQAAMAPAVEMTMEEICKALGKTVKVIK